MRKAVPEDSLSKVMENFFFKKWLPDPALSLDEVEKGVMEAIQLEARPAIENVAHKDESLATSLGTSKKRDGIDISDLCV